MGDFISDILEQLEEFNLNATDDIVTKLQELCIMHNVSAEDIVVNWIAFSTSKYLDMQPTVQLLNQMEKEVLKAKPSKPTKQKKSYNDVSTPLYNSATVDFVCDSNYETPDLEIRKNSVLARSPGVFSPNSLSPARFTPSRKYSSRSGSRDVVCSFGQTQNIGWKHSDEYSCSVSAYSEKTVLRESYRFMCEKLRDKASILNDMIQNASMCYQERYNVEEWGHIQLPSMETVPVVGRICSDGDKLNAASILLEGSLEMSSGQVIGLDISNLEKFSFFPGQVVAGLGVNNSGKKFILNSLYEGVLPPPSSKVPDLANCFDSLSVVIAAGPFATSDTLSYDPLNDLLKYITDHMPHAVILIGPFVDIKNENIESGEMSETYEDLFQSIISEIIAHIEQLSTKVILVPSIRDAHHDFVYPTPPYRVRQSLKRVYLASDPCILNIEGVIFGLTSTDILFHLGKEEISSPQMPDRLGRLCSHILMQKNFYPLYPPNEEINIDYSHFEIYAGLPVIPHILVLPSDLRYFIKDVNGCCCINPERLTKFSAGGTFARLKVKCINENNYSGSIVDSLQVEILKI